MQIQLHKILDVGMCYDILRSIRWELGVKCTNCLSENVVKNGKDSTNIHVQRYHCHSCKSYFDDLSDTIFSGSHQPLHHWITVLYLMNLNASTLQITQELEISEDTARHMCNAIREGIVKKSLILSLAETLNLTNSDRRSGYIIAGHKRQPQNVKKAGRKPRRRRLKGKRGRGTIEDDKCPVLGLVQRGGLVKLTVVPNVQQKTIKLIIEKTITKFSTIYTDEYNIYAKLEEWEYYHKTVNHSLGQYAKDEDGDGVYEVHCNTQECIWSLLRPWLRPHRGVSQEKLPFYVGYFEFLHNLRKRGKKALQETFELLLKPDLRNYQQCLIISPI